MWLLVALALVVGWVAGRYCRPGVASMVVDVTPAPATTPTVTPAKYRYDPDTHKLVRHCVIIGLLLTTVVSSHAGNIAVMDPFTKGPKNLVPGDGIEFVGTTIKATGVPAGGVTAVTFGVYTTGQNATDAAQTAAISAAAAVAESALQPGDVDNEVYATAYNGGALTSATLSAAATAIGSTAKTLVITPGDWSISSAVSFHENTNIKVQPGARFVKATGGTMSISGAFLAAPDQRCFSGFAGGNVTFTKKTPTVYIEWGSPVADGTTDDLAPIASMFLAAAPYTQVVYGYGKTYYQSTTVQDSDSGKRVNLNGCTIKTPFQAMQFNSAVWRSPSTYTVGSNGWDATIQFTAGSTTFTKDTDLDIRVGDTVHAYSNTPYLTANGMGYTRGHWAAVLAVSGDTVTIDVPPAVSFVAETIRLRYQIKDVEIFGGTIDNTTDSDGGTPIFLEANNSSVHHMVIRGGDNSDIGVLFRGNNNTAHHNVISGFLSKNGVSGGRQGDGIAMYGLNPLTRRNIIANCKHNITFSSEGLTSQNPRSEGDYLFQDPARAAELDVLTYPLYSAPLDAHANAIGFSALGTTIKSSGGMGVLVRNGDLDWQGGSIEILNIPAGQPYPAIFNTSNEEALRTLKISNVELASVSDVELVRSTAGAESSSVVDFVNVHTDSNVLYHGAAIKGAKIIGTAAPVSGTWVINDFVENSNQTAGTPLGWRCVAGGTPGTWEAVTIGSGDGSVTSVGLSLPAEFSVTGSPVTSAGDLTAAWATQTTGKAFMSPNGSTGTPSFRAIAAADFGTAMQPQFSVLGVNATPDTGQGRIYGWGSTGTGVKGATSSGIGVFGAATTGNAFQGTSSYAHAALLNQFVATMAQSTTQPVVNIQRNLTLTGGFTATHPVLRVENVVATASANYGPLIEVKKGSTVVFQVNEDGSASHSGALTVSGTINNPALQGTTSTTIDTATNGYADVSGAGAVALTVTNVVAGRVFTIKVTSSGGGAISFVTLTPTWEGSAPATVTATKSTRIVCLGTGANAALCSVAKENF